MEFVLVDWICSCALCVSGILVVGQLRESREDRQGTFYSGQPEGECSETDFSSPGRTGWSSRGGLSSNEHSNL